LRSRRLALAGASVFAVLGVALFCMVVAAVVGNPGFYIWKIFSGKAHGGRYAAINNVQIYFETYGTGPPVLVLHGGLGRLEDMRHQIRALASSRFVIAPDSRGHGRSTDADVPLNYSLMAEDMVELLDRLDIAQVDVVGWSDGGIIGLDLAMRYPERIRRLVAIGSNYDVDGLIKKPEFSVEPPQRRSLCLRCAPDPAFTRKVITMWRTLPHYSLNDLGKINAPTLIIAGEFDVIKRTHSDQLARAISGSKEKIIEGATHSLINEKPDIVNEEILNFLDKP
jgi:pimeloyl-ACP methyl ester carboxylesterase